MEIFHQICSAFIQYGEDENFLEGFDESSMKEPPSTYTNAHIQDSYDQHTLSVLRFFVHFLIISLLHFTFKRKLVKWESFKVNIAISRKKSRVGTQYLNLFYANSYSESERKTSELTVCNKKMIFILQLLDFLVTTER